jgi:3-hydroxyisobutyrate dehydrogenase-like beta-hydroxyacid dehydrogenase
MANIGFVGLGSMSGEMARKLLDAGHTVMGYNRTRSRAQWLGELGMRWGDTPREVAHWADVTLSMVRDTEALHAGTGGPDGRMSRL